MPKESKRVMKVNCIQGRSTLIITVRNDDVPRSSRMIKSKVEANKGEWFLNKYYKGKGKKELEEPLIPLTKNPKKEIAEEKIHSKNEKYDGYA